MTGESKAILVTGATSGIGLETARALAAAGAAVVIGARDEVRGQAVVEEIAARGERAELLRLDLASFASIRRAVERFQASHAKLDVLVNNAGVAMRKRRLSPDGHELTWQTNFLGGYLLTRLLLPLLRAAEKPRVVNVSSEGHRAGRIHWEDLELERGYGTFKSYANSKLAQILFTRELARREPGIAAYALHPGAIATKIWRGTPAPIRWILGIVLPSAKKGAEPVVRLAGLPEPGPPSGRYFDRLRESRPSQAGQNDSDAARLWDVAESAVGLRGEREMGRVDE